MKNCRGYSVYRHRNAMSFGQQDRKKDTRSASLLMSTSKLFLRIFNLLSKYCFFTFVQFLWLWNSREVNKGRKST
jgi:hypothetical protein